MQTNTIIKIREMQTIIYGMPLMQDLESMSPDSLLMYVRSMEALHADFLNDADILADTELLPVDRFDEMHPDQYFFNL